MADDTNEQDAQEPQEGAETPAEGENTEQTGQGSEEAAEETSQTQSWDDFLASLDDAAAERVRSHVKGKTDKLDSDLRRIRGEKRDLQARLSKANAKAAEHDEAVEAQKTAEQKASELNDTLKADNEGLRKRLVTQEIRVQAAAKFADPDDPVGFLEVTDLLGDDLEPDGQAIGDALDDLLARKPHLGKPDPKPRPPAPSKGQGSSANPPPSVESQAAERRKAGDYAGAIELEMSKLGIPVAK